MRPVSAAFQAAVTGSHQMKARARVVAPGQTGTDPDGTEIPIISGDVKLDATADIRGTLDLTTDGTGWDPRVGRHLLQPYGNEVFVERGVNLGGHVEWVSQGYFRLYDVEQDDAPNGPLQLTGRDRMSAIVDAELVAPVQFAKTRTASDVITELVTDVLPNAVIDFLATDRQIGRAQTAERDRYALIKDIADSLSAVVYWDHRGHLVVAPAPSPDDDPVLTVPSGPGGVLVSASRALSRDGVYNAVVATGEGADADNPPQGIAYDNNPNSPTYWGGPFGKVPEFYSSPLLTDASQAKSAARSLLLKAIGLPYAVTFTAVPHPGLEPNDVVRVQYPGGYDNHVVDSLTIPLTADAAMQATTRRQEAIVVGVNDAIS